MHTRRSPSYNDSHRQADPEFQMNHRSIARSRLTTLASLLVLVAGSAFSQAPAPAPRGGMPPRAAAAPPPVTTTPRTTGDQQRQYVFSPTGQTIPYRLYVPTTWNGKDSLPI